MGEEVSPEGTEARLWEGRKESPESLVDSRLEGNAGRRFPGTQDRGQRRGWGGLGCLSRRMSGSVPFGGRRSCPRSPCGDSVRGARAPPGRGGCPICFGVRLRVLVPEEGCPGRAEAAGRAVCQGKEGGWCREAPEGARRRDPSRGGTLTRGTGWSGWSAAPPPAA